MINKVLFHAHLVCVHMETVYALYQLAVAPWYVH